MKALQTEYEFELPKGYADETGNLHKKGKMRLATAADEILPMKDPRVQQNAAYLTVILLARVVTQLGNLKMVSTSNIEELFSSDFTYLQDLYNKINQNGTSAIKAVCPKCDHKFDVEATSAGE